MSYYFADGSAESTQFQVCKRCYGSGLDEDEADCMFCSGMGDVPLRV